MSVCVTVDWAGVGRAHKSHQCAWMGSG